MRCSLWLRCLLLVAAPIMLISSAAVAQKDELCFIETSSGQRVALDKICGKSGGKVVSGFMWDENNYDPNFVSKNEYGIWEVTLGGSHPFKYPSGTIMWPDGRSTNIDGLTVSLVTAPDGSHRNQYYRADKVTPLKPGESMQLSSGETIVQEKFD
jgi:hypothetical protein